MTALDLDKLEADVNAALQASKDGLACEAGSIGRERHLRAFKKARDRVEKALPLPELAALIAAARAVTTRYNPSYAELQARCERLEKALGWYASEANWASVLTPFDADRGDRARAALGDTDG